MKIGPFLYGLAIRLYGSSIWVASFFNTKARAWIVGRSMQKRSLAKNSNGHGARKRLWMHVASLGEFEQGYPVLQLIKKRHPSCQVIVSFFSPSGFQNVKLDDIIDEKYYLPLDTRGRMKSFIDTLKPDLCILVKYDLWYNMLKILSKNNIPVVLVSAVFRPNQWFFRKGAFFLKEVMKKIEQVFCIDQKSLDVLKDHGFANMQIAGDTRIDRVVSNAAMQAKFPLIETFFDGKVDLVCGSTWPKDISVLAPVIKKRNLWVIIVPHEVDAVTINQIQNNFDQKAILYSQLKDGVSNVTTTEKIFGQILIIDEIGMLSKLYRLGQYAYVGGGFNAGIHNILEAVAYQMPVIMGPKNEKFIEANELKALGVAFEVTSTESLNAALDELETKQAIARKASSGYLERSIGASELIVAYVESQGFLH